MGLRWKRGGHLDAQVRARRRGGSWSPWMPLHAAGDHAPDGARAPAGTEPAYTGAADVFQLRLRGSARGLRARFVRAQPTARTARHVTGRLRARAAGPSAPASPSRSSPRSSRAPSGAATPCRRAPRPCTARCRSPSSTTRSARTTTGPRTRRGSCSGSRATTATPTAGTTSATTSSSTSTARCSRAVRAGSTRPSSAPRPRATTPSRPGSPASGRSPPCRSPSRGWTRSRA